MGITKALFYLFKGDYMFFLRVELYPSWALRTFCVLRIQGFLLGVASWSIANGLGLGVTPWLFKLLRC